MPVGSRAHGIVHLAAYSGSTLGVAQPQVEFFQATVTRFQIRHQLAHGLNDLSVAVSKERPTCRNTSQGACQYASQVVLDLVTLNREEQAEYVFGMVGARSAGQ
jgi:hypothetical protein